MPKLPGINHLDAIRALEKIGFVVLRQGKHVVMGNGSRIRTLVNAIRQKNLHGVIDTGAPKGREHW